jgi:V/A-type H+-transporting ATPase subunit K
MTEDPNKFTQVLILQILPSTNGIYGFVAGMLVMVRLDLFAGTMIDLTPEQGALLFFTCLPIGVVGLAAAVAQARVAAGVVSLVAKRPEELAKGILICVMIEFFTIIGLLVTILLLFSLSF